MALILIGLVLVALITGTCLWIAHVRFRDGEMWTPPSPAGHASHYLEQSPDDGHEGDR
jgi:hypothetical protein